MKRKNVLFSTLALLSACGGTPFTATIPPDTVDNGGAEVGTPHEEASALGEAGGDPLEAAVPETGTGAGTHDAGPPDAAPADSGVAPVCTPYSKLGHSSVCAGIYDVPNNFAIATADNNPACWPQITTPPACRCLETYNCECIIRETGCSLDPRGGDPIAIRCDDSRGMEVTVTCR